MSANGTNVGDNAGKISRPTPPSAPLDRAGPQATRAAEQLHSVSTPDAETKTDPARQESRDQTCSDGGCI